MVEAIPAYIAPESVATFEKFKVFTEKELQSRVEIEYEKYAKTINIEARAMIDIACKQIIPAVIKYTTVLGTSLATVQGACPEADVSVQKEMLIETSELLSDSQVALAKLKEVTEIAATKPMGKEQATYYSEVVTVEMANLRVTVDRLEMIVAKEMWPMPSYGDLIFEV